MAVEPIQAGRIIERCREIARLSEEPGGITRTFLSLPMRGVHELLGGWMTEAGMQVSVDAAGNLRGVYAGVNPEAPRLLIGSHLDTVPRAGAFDGVLGVVLGVALVESRRGARLPFAVEVVGFSEEEGVRFGVPFIGSRALAGTLDEELLAKTDARGVSVAQAIRDFGLDPARVPEAAARGPLLGYFEIHIEQGPVLESMGLPLGIVEAIVGQTRASLVFRGQANHAGTTPMNLRRDALAGAAEWVLAVEREARAVPGLVATVGMIGAAPGAFNVIAGEVHASLDVRHARDAERLRAVNLIFDAAREIAQRRGLKVGFGARSEQAAVHCDSELSSALEKAAADAGYPSHRMVSGAGHDAMILAQRCPIAMLFLRSPGGISHHPDENVLPGDVEAALKCGLGFLSNLEARTRAAAHLTR